MTKGSRLNTLTVSRQVKPGRYHDGNGLYLQVSKNQTKSWEFRFTINGRTRYMGLGPLSLVSLADARKKMLECRRLLLEGRDPIEERNFKKRADVCERAKMFTFDACAAAYIDAHKSGWSNRKHVDQWRNTIQTYVSPLIGSLPVQEIDTACVLNVIEPIWYSKTETASRLRSRLELILDWATARELRVGENPARWRGHMDKLLPRRSKVNPTKHFAALGVQELPGFLEKLRSMPGVGPRALEFTILTAVRTGSTLGAQWSEFDLQARVWKIPADRMKCKKEHRVPLSDRTLEILNEMSNANPYDYVFPGNRNSRPLSSMALLAILRRLKLKVTTHGFRSTFRDWVSECTTFSRELAEAALAHTVKDKVEAAYRRGDLLNRRRPLMHEWSRFCMGQSGSAQIIEIQNHHLEALSN